MKAPYSYFGGKSKIAPEIWRRFGDVQNYIEPFFGSGAVLLSRTSKPELELVNDIDGFIVNFWRATQSDAETVAQYADHPAFENDLHARHVWLVGQKESLQTRLEGDPEFYDARIAGWWVWGMSLWIGSGFCSGRGSWQSVNGELVKTDPQHAGVSRQLPHVVDRCLRSDFVRAFPSVQAVVRQLPVLTVQQGVKRNRIELAASPKGIQRKLPESVSARGVTARRDGLYAYFAELQARFERVRVTCGDWVRVVTPAVLAAKTPCAVLLDPPYTTDGREAQLYNEDDGTIHMTVRQWAVENGDNPDLRIAYCGYDDSFAFPSDWEKLAWKTNGGYSNQGEARKANASREVVWFSPHCLKPATQLELF